MLTNDENINAISNLAVTDHLPADIIRSLWLIQSLNIQFNDKKDVLYHNIELLRTVSKFQALAAYSSAGRQIDNSNNDNDSDTRSNELDIDIDIDIDQWINSLSKFSLLENTKVQLFQKTRQLDSEIRRLHNESIREAIKLRLLLDSAKQLLNGFSYQLIQLVFARNWSWEPLKCFILKGTKDFSEENLIEVDYKNTYPNISTYNSPNKYESIMQEIQCFQRRNNETVYDKFSDFDDEFKQLIKELLASKSAKKVKQNKDDFYRKQIVLSLMIKNDAFDRCFNLNNHYKPKVKLIFKAPSSNDSNKRVLKFNRNPPTKSELELPLFSESDSEDSSKTPKVATPKLKLTFKAANNDPKMSDSFNAQNSSHSISDAEIVSMNKSAKMSRTTTEPTTSEAESTQEAYQNDNRIVEEEKEEVYCICRTGSSGKMIGCDDDNCPYGGWFHYKCIGLKSSYSPPKNLKWYCPWCKPKHEKKLSTKNSPEFKSKTKVHYNEKLSDCTALSGSRRSSRFSARKHLQEKASTVGQKIENYTGDPDRLLRKPRKVVQDTVKKRADQDLGQQVSSQMLRSSVDIHDKPTSRHTSRSNSAGDEVSKERQRVSNDLRDRSQASPKVSRLLMQINSSFNPLLPTDQTPRNPHPKKRKQIAIQAESEKSNLNTKKQKKSNRLLQSLKPVNVESSIFAVPEVSRARRLSRRQSERIAPTPANYEEVESENVEGSTSKHARSLRRRMRV